MSHFCNCIYWNTRIFFKYAPETCLLKWKFTTQLTNNANIFRCGRPRYKATTPHRSEDPVLQRIPYVREDIRPRKSGGLLLLVPMITFGLGTWQIGRLRWKTDLINKIEEGIAMEPIPLPLDPQEVSNMEFRKVIVKGTFDHENEIFYGPKPCITDGAYNENVISETGKEGHGYNLVTPLVLSDSGERILVNRGWIRTKTYDPAKRPWSKTEGEQTIVGIVRLSEPQSSFGPPEKKKYKIWHYRLIPEMAKKTRCLPIYIDATVDHSIPNCLWAGQTITKLRNEHLTYIITWYSLGIATTFMWFTRYFKRR